MIVMVDNTNENVEGFGYTNQDGDIEYVLQAPFATEQVSLKYADGEDLSTIYTDDIPNLIKALQAAYNHAKGIK